MLYRRYTAIFVLLALMAAMIPAFAYCEDAPHMSIPERLIIDRGERMSIPVTFEPEDATEDIEWKSSDGDIASVTKKGVLKAKKAGECVIYAVSESGLTAQCAVTVARPVKNVTLNKKTAELGLNRTLQLTADVRPEKAYSREIEWSSSDEAVAEVSAGGLVTAVGKGKATITARAYNGVKAKCVVTVKNIKPKSIKMGSLFVTMHPGATYEIDAFVKPKKASDTGIIYKSDNPAAACVDAGGRVTAIAPGRATITLVASGKKSVKDTVEICVIEASSKRLEGLIIGLNPGHQTKTILKKYPIAPGSKKTAYGCKAGATGRFTGVNEYETNLQIGLMLSEMLTDAGATVVMTRTKNNVSITNIDRAKMLNEAGVDIAIQLHCNSSNFASHNGLSVYRKTKGKWRDEELAMAKALTSAMSEETGAVNLGVKTNDGYMSLNWSTTPAVLLEMGYLSNRREDKLLASDAYRKKMAKGIMEGIADYFGR